MPSRPGHRAWHRYSRRVGLVVALAPLLAACTVGPSATPSLVVAGSQPATTASPTGNASVPLPGLEQSTGQVGWTDCTDETTERLGTPAPPASMTFQCARLIGPIDPSDADDQAGAQRIALLKVGNGPTPLVVVNDLDGLPGTLYAARLAATLPAQFLSTFSLIGIDRRGTAGSSGVHCVPQNDRNTMIQADPGSANLTAMLNASTDAAQQCVLALSAAMAQFNTKNTVADLDLVRQSLGVNHLDAIGHGEGSRVLTTYATEYPGHVGRFVLDGAPDPQLSPQDAAQAQAGAAQATFTAFAQNCAAANCPLANPTSSVNQLVNSVRQAPMAADGIQLTAGVVLRAILIGLADRSQWSVLATDIQQAVNGDGSGLAALIAPQLVGTPQDPPQIDADLVAGCNDMPDRLSPGQVGADMKSWAGKQPLFGGLYAQNLLLCGPWPVPSQSLPKPAAPNTPPIVVISTASDPATPQTGTQRVAQLLDSGVLVNWAGAGHGALGQSGCATSAAQNFLIGGKVPAKGTACPP
ncbi:MAG TPA: alpha/beta fold hydrolase [Pseudonocardiaceae bacterium]